MSKETVELLMLKDLIGDAPAAEQADIRVMIAHFSEFVKQRPAAALVAMSYVALDVQVNPKTYGLGG